jgi:hypothetical protein
VVPGAVQDLERLVRHDGARARVADGAASEHSVHQSRDGIANDVRFFIRNVQYDGSAHDDDDDDATTRLD